MEEEREQSEGMVNVLWKHYRQVHDRTFHLVVFSSSVLLWCQQHPNFFLLITSATDPHLTPLHECQKQSPHYVCCEKQHAEGAWYQGG